MKRYPILILVFFMFAGISCGSADQKAEGKQVKIKTEFGDIVLLLYDETPEHQKNFIKLTEEGFYNGLLFHRVIKNFMIQGGDPESREPKPNVMLGAGGPGYTIPAEFNDKFFHKKGALAAARTGTNNPEKRSSGSQFYIVHGTVYTGGELDTMEMKINFQLKDKLLKEHYQLHTNELVEFRKNNDREGFDLKLAEIQEEVDSIYASKEPYKIPENRRELYTTIGGYPSLDGEYTVFGEVVKGLNVVDSIAAQKTNSINRPDKDVKFSIEMVK